jgi:hypothetical protein
MLPNLGAESGAKWRENSHRGSACFPQKEILLSNVRCARAPLPKVLPSCYLICISFNYQGSIFNRPIQYVRETLWLDTLPVYVHLMGLAIV